METRENSFFFEKKTNKEKNTTENLRKTND